MKILKPKFWDIKNNPISLLLIPISFFLQLLMIIKKKITFKHSFKIPIICIGNIIEKPKHPLTTAHKHAKIPYRVEGTDEDT